MEFLNNTDIVVALGFLIFVGVVIYYGAPRMIVGRLDARAAQIRADLDEARSLREEAQGLLAQYERKQKDVRAQAEEIVQSARLEAERAAEKGKEDIRRSVDRRLKTAGDQIEAAEAAAVKEVRDRAAAAAISAAADVIRSRMSDAEAAQLVDASIGEVGARLH